MFQPKLSHRAEDRLIIHNLVKRDPMADFAEDVRRGLTSPSKHLFPKYLYDELGSQLFEAICLLPEYYLTRAEKEILTHHAGEIVSFEKIDSLLKIDAVDDELRIMTIRFSFAIQRDDVFIVIERTLRSDTADHAQRFHQSPLSFLIE